MQLLEPELMRRVDSLRARIDALTELRDMLRLPGGSVAARQWAAIVPAFAAQAGSLRARVAGALRGGWAGDAPPRQALARSFGQLELDLSRSYELFDTYMDVLSQRLVPGLGTALAGCDRIAQSALRCLHAALCPIGPPLVYCDRGHGASMLREGVRFPDGTPNPVTLVQIPYVRLRDKLNLTSIAHEVGHEALGRLGLVKALAEALSEGLARAGAPALIAASFAHWSKELGPDFWSFAMSGPAQTATVSEILFLPPSEVLRISPMATHPPPLLRLLASVGWCRRSWGAGPWDRWAKAWRETYDLRQAPRAERQILAEALRWLPVATELLFTTRFRVLSGRALPELFDRAGLSPDELTSASQRPCQGALARPAGVQLAVFRWAREHGTCGAAELDEMMTRWLEQLAALPL